MLNLSTEGECLACAIKALKEKTDVGCHNVCMKGLISSLSNCFETAKQYTYYERHERKMNTSVCINYFKPSGQKGAACVRVPCARTERLRSLKGWNTHTQHSCVPWLYKLRVQAEQSIFLSLSNYSPRSLPQRKTEQTRESLISDN